MTETGWLTSWDPKPMLEVLRGRASERKLRLFACACCRRLGHHPWGDLLARAIQFVERYADGEAEVRHQVGSLPPGHYILPGYQITADALADSLAHVASAAHAAAYTGGHGNPVVYDAASRAEYDAQAHLLRCLFGNPFRPAALDPAWLAWGDGAVRKLAASIYDGHRFGDLPILADALEEAGCDNADVLAHCRSPDAHARGCWVVDAVCGRH